MTIIKTKWDLSGKLKNFPAFSKAMLAISTTIPGFYSFFADVADEMVRKAASAPDAPDFGEDWEEWLNENVDDLVADAIQERMKRVVKKNSSQATIFNSKKDIDLYIKNSPAFVTPASYDEASREAVRGELVDMMAGAMGSPDFGEDWGSWMNRNFAPLLAEAIERLES
jgi:hypothetical protein